MNWSWKSTTNHFESLLFSPTGPVGEDGFGEDRELIRANLAPFCAMTLPIGSVSRQVNGKTSYGRKLVTG